jgi:hypothetical protein
MKNVFLGIALVAMTVACTSEPKNAVVDPEGPNVECTDADCEKACCASECSGEKAAECSGEKAAECSGEAEAKTCPVTGKAIN